MGDHSGPRACVNECGPPPHIVAGVLSDTPQNGAGPTPGSLPQSRCQTPQPVSAHVHVPGGSPQPLISHPRAEVNLVCREGGLGGGPR